MTAYETFQQSAAYYLPAAAGCLRLLGEDRLNFLQRQTTNDLRLVSPTRAVRTVLTSPVARILDVLVVLTEDTSQETPSLKVLTLPGRQVKTLQFFRSRIFFMDRVEASDISAEWYQVDIEGPQAAAALRHFGVNSPPSLDEVVTGYCAGQPFQILAHPGLAELGYRLLVPARLASEVQATLERAGLPLLDRETYEVLRIEAGLPGTTSELTEEFTPLEAGLREIISDHKGCYTGQEVIARQVNYDKITRHLVGLRLPAPASAGATILAGDHAVGTLTSVAHSPRFGPIALGIVRRPHHEPGSAVLVETSQGRQPAQIIALPFTIPS